MNGRKWRNCWMIVTPTSLTSEMSLSWPPRYTSIHELNKIINSPNILSLSSFVPRFVLASLQGWTVAVAIKIRTVILCTVTDRAHSRFDVHFTWHSNDVYKLNIWIYMKWVVGKQARFWLQFGGRAIPSRDPFLRILSRGASEPGDSKGAHMTSCFEN